MGMITASRSLRGAQNRRGRPEDSPAEFYKDELGCQEQINEHLTKNAKWP